MRVVLDSNVLVSAFAGRGLCYELWEACIGVHTVIVGEQILVEVRRAFEDKLKFPKGKSDLFTSYIRSESEFVAPVDVPDADCRDPSDIGIIGIAVAGKADAIVSGDGDLLSLGKYASIPILSPRQFWERVSKK